MNAEEHYDSNKKTILGRKSGDIVSDFKSIMTGFAESYHSYKTRWMKVEEELPEKDGMYLVQCSINGAVCRVFNTYHDCWDDEQGDGHYSESSDGIVKKWKPLPNN